MKIIKTSLTSIILSCLSVLVTADGGSYLVRASITVLTAADRPTLSTLVLQYCEDIVRRERNTLSYEVWETVDPKVLAFKEAYPSQRAFNSHVTAQQQSVYFPPLVSLVGSLNVWQYVAESEDEGDVPPGPKLTKRIWSKRGGGGD